MSGQKNLFIISPIGPRNSEVRLHFDKVRKHIIDPVATEKGYESLRSDEIAMPGRITSQIIDHLKHDDLVIADLSRRNPNVYYELAIRHAVQKPVILIGESELDIPFDLAAQRVIPYTLDPDDIIKAKTRLRSQIDSVESDRFIIDSPVEDIIRLERTESVGDENGQQEIIAILRSLSERLTNLEEFSETRAVTSRLQVFDVNLGDRVQVYPNVGAPGLKATVYSTNHTSGAEIKVYFDVINDENLIGFSRANPDGTCIIPIQIPQSNLGNHYLWVVDLATLKTERIPYDLLS